MVFRWSRYTLYLRMEFSKKSLTSQLSKSIVEKLKQTKIPVLSHFAQREEIRIPKRRGTLLQELSQTIPIIGKKCV